MPKFTCKSAVHHDGKEYKAGDTIELTEEQAAPLEQSLEPMPAPLLTPAAPSSESSKPGLSKFSK